MFRALSAVVLMLFAAAPAHSEIVIKRYDLPATANYAISYGYFGDEFPLTGQIISTTLVIHYTARPGQDAANFFYTFDVPVLGAKSAFIGLEGQTLGWSGEGTFHHVVESTDLYNGTIREGRFGTQIDGGGTLTDSYLEFVVDADPRDPIFEDGFEEW